jgi:hypothetical protein
MIHILVFYINLLLVSTETCEYDWGNPDFWGPEIPSTLKNTLNNKNVTACMPEDWKLNKDTGNYCGPKIMSICHGNEFWNGRQAYIVKPLTYAEFLDHFKAPHNLYEREKPEDKWLEVVEPGGGCGCIDVSDKSYEPETSSKWEVCPDGVHPYPLECSQYYSCSNGKSTLQDCGSSLYFNGLVCDYPYLVDCRPIPNPIDGGWSEWTDWTACTELCGGGTRNRTRECNNPLPAYGGKDCEGSNIDQEACNESPCPINGGWSEWTDWTACTELCGGGTRNRTRECNNPLPAYGGKDCEGSNIDQEACNEGPCPINGGWSEWTDWTACTELCGGGTRNRTRECNNPLPAYEGKVCEGSNIDQEACNEDPCPINGGWSEWTDWTACTELCGGGTRNRTRECNNPLPAYEGKDCEGSNIAQEACNEGPCPINGGWSDWSAWSACSKTCGGGVQYSRRTCSNPKADIGGEPCTGPDEKSQVCNQQECASKNNPSSGIIGGAVGGVVGLAALGAGAYVLRRKFMKPKGLETSEQENLGSYYSNPLGDEKKFEFSNYLEE